MSIEIRDKIYLGDAVYAGQDGYHIWLWTSDGVEETNHIALEPAVLDSLDAYRKKLLERVRVAKATAFEDAGEE